MSSQTFIKIKIPLFLLFIPLMLGNACKSLKSSSNKDFMKNGFTQSYCSPNVPYLTNEQFWQDAGYVDLNATGISTHNIAVCKCIGISHNVMELWKLRNDTSKDHSIRVLQLQQKITAKLLLAQSQLMAVVAELSCEGERCNLASDYIDGIDNRKIKHLTVAWVVLGAITSIAAVSTNNNKAQLTIGIGGGLSSAALGFATIDPKGATIPFYHPRNSLATIWTDPQTNTYYPGFIWSMLHEKIFSKDGNTTLIECLHNRWREFEFNNKTDQTQQELLFGVGGNYDSDNLHTRASMINQLEATVRSLNQELTGMMQVTAMLQQS